MKQLKQTILLATALSLCASCSSTNNAIERSYPKSREEVEEERIGKLTGEEGLVIFGGNKKRGNSTADAISVNSYLWRASLDVVHFMPVITADPFGGTILTDWYASSIVSKERLKVNVFIIGSELRSDGVKVTVFKQIKNSKGDWVDAGENVALSKDLEDKILIKARSLKFNGTK